MGYSSWGCKELNAIERLSTHTSIYLLAVLGLRCCAGFSLVADGRGYSLVVVRGLLIVVVSFVADGL